MCDMHTEYVVLSWQVVQPRTDVHEPTWTSHVKRPSDVAQSHNSTGNIFAVGLRCVHVHEKPDQPTGDGYCALPLPNVHDEAASVDSPGRIVTCPDPLSDQIVHHRCSSSFVLQHFTATSGNVRRL